MSWALRAHIRNLVLRASLGSSFASSDELKKGSSAKCTLDLCPYPRFDAARVAPPPTDDPKFVQDNVAAALATCCERLSIRREFVVLLRECSTSASTHDLVCDLFWFCYLTRFGIHHAAPRPSTVDQVTFRAVLTDVFIENDMDENGTVDPQELSALLARLDVALPPECCADLIAIVDSDGRGALDLDDFLSMMCIEVISDIFVGDVRDDIGRLHARCSERFCQAMSPFKLSLAARDAIQAPFCAILADAVFRCFEGTFGLRLNRDDLRASITETIMVWFTGMRQPLQLAPAVPPRRSPRSRPASASAATRSPRSPQRPATAEVASAARTAAAAPGVEAGAAELRKALALMAPRRAPQPPASRQAASARVLRVAKLSEAYHKHVGQRAPPVPTINLLGCSNAFTETFRTPRPTQPLRTLGPEHAAWAFEPGRHSRHAARCGAWRDAASAATKSQEQQVPGPPPRERHVAAGNSAKRLLIGRAERMKEAEIIANREWGKLRAAWRSAEARSAERAALDDVAGAAAVWEPVARQSDKLLRGPLLRYLPREERAQLSLDGVALGKRLAKLRRELRYRAMREAQRDDGGSS